MILHSLRLQNFRRFRRAEIEFPENVIGLLGRNGAGKSTLLEAMAWALYGGRAARTDKLQIRSQFAGERESCEVELTFTLGGEKYRVLRSLAGKNAAVEAALYHGDSLEPAAVRDSGVNQAIEKLLGLDHRAFEASIFAKQKELAALSDLQDEQRRKIVSRLINLEAVDRARQHVLSDANEKRKFLEGAQAAQVDIPTLEQQLSQQQKNLESAQALLRQQEERAREFAVRLEMVRKKSDEESLRRDQYNRWQAELALLRSRQQELARQQQQIEKDQQEILREQPRLEALRPQRDELARLSREREALLLQQQKSIQLEEKKKFAGNLLAQISARQAEAKNWQQQLEALQKLNEHEAALEKRHQQTQADLLKWRAEERRLSNELEGIKTRGTDLKSKLEQVQKLGAQSPCPVCTRPLAEHFPNVMKHFDEALVKLRHEYAQINEARKQAEAALHRAEAADEAVRQEQKNLGAQRERLAQVQNNLLRRQNEIDNLQKQLQEVQNEIHHLGPVTFEAARLTQVNAALREVEAQAQELTKLEAHASRLPEISRRLAETQKQISESKENEAALQAHLRTLQFNEESYLATRREYEEANANYLRSQQQLGEAKGQVNVAEAEVRNLEQALGKARELQETIRRTKREVMLLDSLQGHLKIFRAELGGRLRPLIADRASELLRMITAGRYSLLELDESYNIFLYDRRERYSLARFSGGEQDVANLCLRVAISQVIAQRSGKPPLQFIVLDEIFGSQDEERKMMVLATLQQLSHYFRQIFLITHVESIKENLPVALQVEMVGEASEVKVM
ncbi:MAG: SMC family ATPase [candidate division KSB1 bacterium]|nr:SMC family ATPase [candidate division KSB1 bacterium]MDZ7365368.1 SMC family ATPase [candidate division KSB1 bacterium]MDZ7403585.1 SMC family ATPase [candidate division KSB1 bacterium]